MGDKGVGTNSMLQGLISSENGFSSSTQPGREPPETFHEHRFQNEFPELRPSPSWLKRPGLWAIVATLICGTLFFLYWHHAQSVPQVNCETANADRGPVTIKVTATGNLSALLTVQVGSQVSGLLRRRLAKCFSVSRCRKNRFAHGAAVSRCFLDELRKIYIFSLCRRKTAFQT